MAANLTEGIANPTFDKELFNKDQVTVIFVLGGPGVGVFTFLRSPCRRHSSSCISSFR